MGQTKAEWLEELEEYERTVGYTDEVYRFPVTQLREYTRFREGGEIYIAFSKPFSLGGNTYVTVWQRGYPRAFRKEMKFPNNVIVEQVTTDRDAPLPHWYFDKLKRERENG